MRRAALPLLLACASCGGGSSAPDQTPRVAVTAIAPHQGRVTRWLSAYGAAAPAANGTQTLSVNQPGQIVQLLITAGASVRAGQPLVTFAVVPGALAGYEAARTTLETARKQRDTTARLLAQQLATGDQMAQAEKAVTDAQAALAALQADGAATASRTLRAPFDGIVTALPVAIGDRTQPGAPLATVARRGALIATVGIDPAGSAPVAAGQTARLTRLSGGPALPAQVLRIDGQIDPTTHLISVDLSFAAGALLPGEPIRAEIATGEAGGWLVPHAAVATDGAGPHVFQIASGKAHAVPVTIVQTGAQEDVVAGPIAAARPLIVDGAYQVSDGDAVRTGR